MITEDQLEQLAIQWFQDTGWNYVHGAALAPEGVAAEREDTGNIEHRTLNIEHRREELARRGNKERRYPIALTMRGHGKAVCLGSWDFHGHRRTDSAAPWWR
jgi:hypothetical protein